MKKRSLCLLIALAMTTSFAVLPTVAVERELPRLPDEPAPVVLEKETPPLPEELPTPLDEPPSAAADFSGGGIAQAQEAQADSPAFFSTRRAASQAVAVELSTDGKVAGTVHFLLDNETKTAALSSADPDIEGMLVVPHTVAYEGSDYTVTVIGPGAFSGQTALTQLWLPHTVSELGYEAFMNCDHLLAVGTYDEQGAADPYALPEKVDYIGDRTFRGCTRLSSVTIPANVERISAWAFAYCYSLGRGGSEGVRFAAGSRLTTIDQGAFYYCTALESILLPQGLRSISLQAFSHCASQDTDGVLHGLKTLVIPSTVTEMGEEAFSYCGALKEAVIPAGIKELPQKAFYACSALETVDFSGDGLTSMGHSAFFWCTKLKDVRTGGISGLPSTLKAISRWAFYRCDSLAQVDLSGASALKEIEPYAFNESGIVSLTLPQGLKKIGMLAFESCANLKYIDWNRPEQDNDLLVVEEKAFAKTGLEAVTVPQLYDGSGLEIFYDCDSLLRVKTAPAALFIPNGAFRDCDSLTAVELGDHLRHVGQQAFYTCPSLTDVDLASAAGLTTIGPLAFCRTSLPTVSLPASIKSIGLDAFGINRSLSSIEIAENNPGGYYSTDGVLYQNKDSSVLLVKYPAGKPGTVFTVPDGVTAIESYAFSHSEKLTEVAFPASLRVIGYYALSHCINLRTANVPANVEQGAEIFEGSYQLSQVELPPDLTELTSSSFPINSKVTSVTIPAGVSKIDVISPFSSLSLLREIQVAPDSPYLKSEDGVLFSKDGSVLYAYPPAKADTEYRVPDGVTTIWFSAFTGAANLEKLTIPAGVTAVRSSACHEITALKELEIWADVVPERNPNLALGYNQFLSALPEGVHVYINGDPGDKPLVDDFHRICVGENAVEKQNIHVGFYRPVVQTGDRFISGGVVYTLADPAAQTVKVGENPYYAAGHVTIPTQVDHGGKTYTVISVEAGAFAEAVSLSTATVMLPREQVATGAFQEIVTVTYRDGLEGLTAGNNRLSYGDTLIVNAPTEVEEGSEVILTAGGKKFSALVKGGAASFPVNGEMMDAFGDAMVGVTAEAGEVTGFFGLALSPKILTVDDLPWYNSSVHEMFIEKPYDGTTALDYTDTKCLQNFAVKGEKLALHVTGTLPEATMGNTFHAISDVKVELVGDTAQYYRVSKSIGSAIKARVTYGQLYIKEVGGVLQQPTFRRVWAAEDGMRLMDCIPGGGEFVAYLPTVEDNAITGYTQVEVNGLFFYDEANHYPGLSSVEELGVQQNQDYKWMFIPSGNGKYQSALNNYRFFGAFKPWDPSLSQDSADPVGRTGENPPLPAYVLPNQEESNSPARPSGNVGTVSSTPSPDAGDPGSDPSDGPSDSGSTGGGSSSGDTSSDSGSSGGSSQKPSDGNSGAGTPSPAEPSDSQPPAPVETSVQSQQFQDVDEGDWYYEVIQYVCEKGIMRGIEDNSFAPEAVTTRGTIVTMLYRLEKEPAAAGSSFHDVAGDLWYAGGVSWAASAGLVNGYEDGSFRPEIAITREQLVTILYRYAAGKGMNVTVQGELNGFSDVDQISPFAREAMAWAVASGILHGQDWGGLNPAGITTRAEAAALLMRFCERI